MTLLDHEIISALRELGFKNNGPRMLIMDLRRGEDRYETKLLVYVNQPNRIHIFQKRFFGPTNISKENLLKSNSPSAATQYLEIEEYLLGKFWYKQTEGYNKRKVVEYL